MKIDMSYKLSLCYVLTKYMVISQKANKYLKADYIHSIS